MEMPGWSEAGFDDAKWQAAQGVAAPGGVLAAQMIEPIRVTETLKPIAVNAAAAGRVDFRHGPEHGRLVPAQGVRPARARRCGCATPRRSSPTARSTWTTSASAKVTDIYTLKGEGSRGVRAALYLPRFSLCGGDRLSRANRGCRRSKGKSCMTICRARGEFACSNPLLNRIYRNIVWGVSGNYRSIPTDCPQRDERQGWLGDRSAECKGRDLPLRHRRALRQVAAGHGRCAEGQRQRAGRLPGLLADLFGQRHLAEQHGDYSRGHCGSSLRMRAIIAQPLRQREEVDGVHGRLRQQRDHRPRLLWRLVRAAGGPEADSLE